MKTILFIALAAFVVYAIYSQYSKTPAEQGVPARVWASLVAAAGALGALVMSWFQTGSLAP